ncbi:60S ribosomal export protein NMD3 [Lingula anatina]|uniref:60S ribosomal export protein NMD3 n=1 Tax=Lingula anatina TaxID=7574 RepID=A0A1S3KGE3_LINAN|nr:60S ribosomal export protein NMD3 [Lingula anatina]|eukprot:XP_013421301.1 60S ribosomal export protein NMD3 [Lingula anatina]
MEYLPETSSTQTNMILCCSCGTAIEPNPTNMCIACLRADVDITEGIPKQGTIYFCRNCERYLQPPSAWVAASLESRELLTVCLKKLKGLNKVRLVDAGFIWTEPHSKRIKVKLTIQKEVVNGAVLQQVFVVEFTVNNQMCDDCHKVEAKDYWKACVQVRQKTSHKKTFFYLEQLILKHNAHANTVSIVPVPDGIDFFYHKKEEARTMVNFLQAVVPCRYQTSQQLISHDVHSNTYNYKTTFSVEIVPICKDNVVCLPPKLAQSLGGMNPICLCQRVTQTIHLIDVNTLQIAEMSGTTFWRTPFSSLCEPRNLTEFVVMDIQILFDHGKQGTVRGPVSQKHVLADVWVARPSEMGEKQYFCRTHLGHLLQPGDSVLGFDLNNSNVNDKYLESLPADKIPDVVIVKKIYDKSKRQRKRKWKLKRLEQTEKEETSSIERDYNDFLDDLEEDPGLRQNVNIYKDAQKLAVDQDDTSDDEDVPHISLQEMLDDLHISEDATGEEGAAMME